MRKIITLLLISLGLLSGQRPKTSPEERQEILNYQLTLPRANHLITAMEAMTNYLVSLPDFMERMRKAANMTPAERRAKVENDPKAMAILKQNGLSEQEYLTGVPALRMALLA